LSLQLRGATAVPDPERAEEIALEITGDVAELISLAQTLPPQVQRQGLFLDRRSFRARLTIATGGPFDARSVIAALATFESVPWKADEMTLVRILPGGADIPDVWEQVERYPFTASPDAE
jgi:2'-5' RNA ligase